MTKTRKKKKVYNVNKRVFDIYMAVYNTGSKEAAAKTIVSEVTGRPLSAIAIYKYLESNGFKITMGPYLSDLEGNLIDPDSLGVSDDQY
jgi:hypothetical protein